ncbi:phage protein Gp27 family protein [Segnochrobactrum spirostomi]|uniref:DUF3486 family protein n=1 Tax=Segnochrobactrum spirostomi TaxID=2608987 RepID=A0A6A7Y5C5_9HYPH|nr:phage protein Gp27 family protein [Segnochrobactrum spirostomi]MQT14400.1 DUF3486 family protein [Segnochrobactrum spirostomi]
MSRSTVKKLPPEVRDWIMRLRDQGRTYDEIIAALRGLDTLAVVPSRSALHRHVQQAERARELVERQRIVAASLAKELGAEDDGRVVRGNITMLHAILTRIQMAALEAEEGGDADPALSPQEAMQLAKALDHLGKAAKDDVARTIVIEKRAQERAIKAAEEAVDTVIKQQGGGAESIAALKAAIGLHIREHG